MKMPLPGRDAGQAPSDAHEPDMKEMKKENALARSQVQSRCRPGTPPKHELNRKENQRKMPLPGRGASQAPSEAHEPNMKKSKTEMPWPGRRSNRGASKALSEARA